MAFTSTTLYVHLSLAEYVCSFDDCVILAPMRTKFTMNKFWLYDLPEAKDAKEELKLQSGFYSETYCEPL